MKEKVIKSGEIEHHLYFDDDDYELIFNKLGIGNVFVKGGPRKNGHHQTYYVQATLTETLKKNLIKEKIKFREENKKILIHRLIMNPDHDKVINHKNKNGLDNRRENLEICTISHNNHDSKIRKDNTSGVKNVTIRDYGSYVKYEASINVNKEKFCKQFDTIQEAKEFINKIRTEKM